MDKGIGGGVPYRVPTEPNPLHRIPHQAQSRSLQLPHHTNIALHIHERHRQQ